MKPEVRKAAVSGVKAVVTEGAWVRAWLAAHTGRLAPHERAQAHDLLAGTVRWLSRLDRLLDRHARRRPDPWVRDLARVALYQLDQGSREPPHAVVSETVELARRVKGEHVAGWINGVLRAFLREPDRAAAFTGPAADADARAFAPWLFDRFVGAWGVDEARRVADGLNRPAVLDLRLNRARLTPEALVARLGAQGLEVAPLPDLPDAFTLTSGRGLFDDEGFDSGEWIVQDRTSQRVATEIGRHLRGRVLDACSGNGVKLLAWDGLDDGAAPEMASMTSIVAVDRSVEKLRRGRELLQRWTGGRARGVPVQALALDATATGFPDASFDAVVVDAPCSGTGTLRRRPEIKVRLTPQAVADLADLQGRLLTEAARVLKPGGTLAYAVCSLLPDEGPAVVTRFLEQSPTFTIDSDAFRDAPGATVVDGVTRLFDPDAAGDGFQVALLRRGH